MKRHHQIRPKKTNEIAQSSPVSEMEMIFSEINQWSSLEFEARVALTQKIRDRLPEPVSNIAADIEIIKTERYGLPPSINCFLNEVAIQLMEPMINKLLGCQLNPEYPKNTGVVLYQGDQYQLDVETKNMIDDYRSRLD